MDEPRNIYEDMEEFIEGIADEADLLCRSDEESINIFDGTDWIDIEFSRCDTHGKVLAWVNHLVRKSWITPKHISLFLANVYIKYPDLETRTIDF